MALIDIKINPSRKDLLIFAVLWALFFVLLAHLAQATPNVLLTVSAITGAAFLISIVFNRDYPRSRQIIGAAIPLTLLAIGGLETYAGVSAQAVTWTLYAIGGVGLLLIALSPAAGRAIYTQWMFAAMPIGWTLSHVLLGMVLYLVITPIGLAMRLAGYDPLRRKLDPKAETYWIKRPNQRPPASYFKQF